MVVDDVVKQFGRMGARAGVADMRIPDRLRLDIARDRLGQFFDIRAGGGMDVRVVDVRPDSRHLLLMGLVVATGEKHKFLCGHDEREWFVAGVPNDRGVSNVRTAIEALKPPLVRAAQDRLGVRTRDRSRRRTGAYVRQGEWFFLPAPAIEAGSFILRNEPLRRGRGKPHWADECFRNGGELVYVNRQFANGLTESERAELFQRNAGTRQMKWTPMRRNPEVYVRGRIRHPDHATVILPCWHLVQMNTEHRTEAMRHVAFLD